MSHKSHLQSQVQHQLCLRYRLCYQQHLHHQVQVQCQVPALRPSHHHPHLCLKCLRLSQVCFHQMNHPCCQALFHQTNQVCCHLTRYVPIKSNSIPLIFQLPIQHIVTHHSHLFLLQSYSHPCCHQTSHPCFPVMR